MIPKPTVGGFRILILTALATVARLCAQDSAPAATGTESPATAVPAPRVLNSRTVPLPDGRTLTIQRVSSLPRPVAEPPPPQVPPPTAPRPPRLVPQESRLLMLYVTRFADDLSYLEWTPFAGGAPFGAWSNADLDALRMVPEVAVTPDNIRWTIFPLLTYTPVQRPLPVPLAAPQLPADGPGFQIVRGNPGDAPNIAPVAALHKLYKEHGAALKLAWEQHEARRLAEAAARAALPPANIILNYSPVTPGRREGGAH
jgi:hypothetical protein